MTLLPDFGDEQRYRMHWDGHVQLLRSVLTKSRATVLEAVGAGNERAAALRVSHQVLPQRLGRCCVADIEDTALVGPQ